MNKLQVLLVGSGGREHALAWKLSQSSKVTKLYCAPGNAGISSVAECVPIKVDDIQGLVDFCKQKKMDLVVVGPELPLTLGLVDELERAGIKAFGPSKKAAEIEGSKAFSKDLMKKYDIPTARYGVFYDMESARNFAREMKGPWVVKADGLAAGKGVLICATLEETYTAIEKILRGEVAGLAGEKLVIEEFLEGEELSVLAFCDGKTIVPMVPSQDHKQIYDGDKGPNTGGMGAYSPVPAATPELLKEVEEKVLIPTVKAMEQEGRPYRGVLYAGLMLTKEGTKVLEYNARFGDPETQVVVPRLETDLCDIILAVIEGRLQGINITWKKSACINVVMASGGYPGSYNKGYPISGLEDMPEDVIIFHSGTSHKEGQIVTAGGRVLSVSACGQDIKKTQARAYQILERIKFKDAYYRKDIANKAIKC